MLDSTPLCLLWQRQRGSHLNAAIRVHIPASVHSLNMKKVIDYTDCSLVQRAILLFSSLELPLLGNVRSTHF